MQGRQPDRRKGSGREGEESPGGGPCRGGVSTGLGTSSSASLHADLIIVAIFIYIVSIFE